MPNYLTPNIYIEEISTGPRPIEAVGTSTAAFLGKAPDAATPAGKLVSINNWSQFLRGFAAAGGPLTPLAAAVFGFFQNGGRRCWVLNVGDGPLAGGKGGRNGIDLLEEVDEVAIVAAPGFTDAASYTSLLDHCEKMQDRVAIMDAPKSVEGVETLTKVATPAADGKKSAGMRPRESKSGFGAFYFPWIKIQNPFSSKDLVEVPPSGHLAGIYARTDASRGVHKAPANEPIRGALDVTYYVTNAEQEVLNPAGINAIRFFQNEGVLVWGARTVAASASEWRYLNVRRLFCMIEKSIARSTRWVVFESNDEPLWKAIIRDVTAFLTTLWRDGALMGATAQEAFFVQCDHESNPPEEIDAGRVITVIGIAPVKPAEFIVFRIGQSAAGAKVEA